MRLELAWLLATASDAGARNGAEAVALAEGVCRDLQWKSVRALDVLAAAYAEAGRMPEAIAAMRRGLACAAAGAGATVPAAVALPPGVRTPWSPRPRGSMDPDDLRARLQLYEQGQPYHEA
jgi:hypothetical protein